VIPQGNRAGRGGKSQQKVWESSRGNTEKDETIGQHLVHEFNLTLRRSLLFKRRNFQGGEKRAVFEFWGFSPSQAQSWWGQTDFSSKRKKVVRGNHGTLHNMANNESPADDQSAIELTNTLVKMGGRQLKDNKNL